MLQFLSGQVLTVGTCSLLGGAVLLGEAGDVLLHPPAGKPTRDPEGPWEDSSTKRESETRGRGVQVRPSTRKTSVGIRDDLGEALAGVDGDDSQQLMPGGSCPTSHARPE